MEARKLTENEIDKLFTFCRRHGIKHYDLQLELVDHLAIAIEEFWEQKPNMPFQYALNQVFDSFGFLGFEKIKRAKEKSLQRKHNRLFFGFVINYFKLPKLILLAVATLFLFVILQISQNDGIIIGLAAFLFLPFGIYYHFYFAPKCLEIKLVSPKTFLVVDYLENLRMQLLFIFLLPFQSISYYSLFKEGISSLWMQLLVSFTIVLLSILVYASCIFVPLKFKQHFTEQYPQFVKA